MIARHVSFGSIIHSKEFNNDYLIPIAAGIDDSGKPLVFDLAAAPHILIGGATASGKTVLINDIIVSILHKMSPEDVSIVLIDSKGTEFENYYGVPHIDAIIPIDIDRTMDTLNSIVDEIDIRHTLFSAHKVNSVEQLNKACRKKYKRKVLIIDEFADFSTFCRRQFEWCVSHITQHGGDVGIHLILSTQLTNENVLSKALRLNIPCRIAFRVCNRESSKLVIGRFGAEKISDLGDMLYVSSPQSIPIHAHAPRLGDSEIRKYIDEAYEKAYGG